MKKYNKYIGLFLLSLVFFSCDNSEVYPEITAEQTEEVALNTNGLDFSKYVAIGASFTAGTTDNALFIKAQENSFPNILAKQFGVAESFTQPLMNDNVGGLLVGGTLIAPPRLYFNGQAPAVVDATPTTDIATNNPTGTFSNLGVPGAKSFHFIAPGYGNLANFPTAANPYAVRMTGSTPDATVVELATAQNPTFFTLSEVGGNDVLGYATSGGDGTNPITDTATFNTAIDGITSALLANGAKGVVGNVPYITSLAHFTTIPYNPVPLDAATVTQLNTSLLGPVIQVLTALGQGDRFNLLVEGDNPLLLKDENLTDLSAQLIGALQAAGVDAAQASLMGNLYGQARHATATDLFVLPLSALIGTEQDGIPAPFNSIGVTYPLEDKWTLTPEEQDEIKTATDAYNTKISEIVSNNSGSLVLVDLKGILENAATNGVSFDQYTLTTSLVSGGLISLDGVHLTARGYALMANEILKAIDSGFGSNFGEATNGLAKADDYPTNYAPTLQ